MDNYFTLTYHLGMYLYLYLPSEMKIKAKQEKKNRFLKKNENSFLRIHNY